MTTTSSPLCWIGRNEAGVADLRTLLDRNHGPSVFGPWNPPAETPRLIVVDGRDVDDPVAVCRNVNRPNGDSFVPMVLLSDDVSAGLRQRAIDAGVDVVLPRSLTPEDFAAQIQALLRMKDKHDALAARAAEAQRINKRLQATYQQINNELDLARRLQQSFLPQSLPDLPQVRFAVEYRPCNQVGGDFYDVFRLDENHFGFYVADAMGHGVSASLLTIFVKKGVRAKDIDGQTYRLVSPDEVLHRLNLDFIDQALSDTPFITMAYGLFNFRDGILQFSRAGHPYPLFIPREGPVESWAMEGSLLGVFATQYRLRMHQLRPGDKVLFYTDGFDAGTFGDAPPGAPSLLAAAERLRHLPIERFVEQLVIQLFASSKPTDDVTLFGFEIPA